MERRKIIIILTSILLAVVLIYFGVEHNNQIPKSVYQVYLDGEVIGLIEDKEELLNMIDEEQQDIKDTYGVTQVYPPNGFDIEEYITYNENITTASKIYETIQEKSDFTIEGYVVTITREASEEEEETVTKIYVLDEDVYYTAEQNFIYAFVDEETYNDYINNTQEEITDVGSYINYMEFEETITIKQTYISTKEEIFTDADTLTQYLLYGTTEPTSSYVVQLGDTLSSIAEASKLSVEELIIANPKYRNENAVLAIGETIKNDIIDPILTLYQEVRITEDVEQAYTKQTVLDESLAVGTSIVSQTGVTGIERVTQVVRVVNGERNQDTNIISSVTIRSSVDEITTVGPTKTTTWTGNGGYSRTTINTGLSWGWPTETPYVITTDYTYRWGSFHEGIDISGTGSGSPIYASRAGTVVAVNTTCANTGYYGSSCGNSYGNYVVIEHENNYYTMYAHLLKNVTVAVGSTVSKGDVIGYMGSSGSSTGTHLHFGFAVGNPLSGGTWYSPWSLFG